MAPPFLNFNLSSPCSIATCSALYATRIPQGNNTAGTLIQTNALSFCTFGILLLFSEIPLQVMECFLKQAFTCTLHYLKGLLDPFCFRSKRKKIPQICKIKISLKIIKYCMHQSNTFLQLAKGSQITLGEIAKSYQISLRANWMLNRRMACSVPCRTFLFEICPLDELFLL